MVSSTTARKRSWRNQSFATTGQSGVLARRLATLEQPRGSDRLLAAPTSPAVLTQACLKLWSVRQILVSLVDLVLVVVVGVPVPTKTPTLVLVVEVLVLTKMPTLVLVEEVLVPTKMLMLEPQQQQQQPQQVQ